MKAQITQAEIDALARKVAACYASGTGPDWCDDVLRLIRLGQHIRREILLGLCDNDHGRIRNAAGQLPDCGRPLWDEED